MADLPLIVRSPQREQDAGKIIELACRCFPRYYDLQRDLRQWYLLGESHYDWEASAIGQVNGTLATHFGIWGYEMRIGKSVVRCGGVGGVATEGEFRKQGLMERTVPHSLLAMRRLGYDLSILFGIQDFYHRFGYVRAWNDESWFITRDRLPKDLPAVKFERYQLEPRSDILRMHNRINREMTGSAVRPTYRSCATSGQGSLLRAGLEGYLWQDARGRLSGHVVVREAGGRLVCSECLGDADETLAVLAAIATRMGVRELQFDTLPFNSTTGRRLRQLSCRREQRYAESGNAMVRIINLESWLRKMEVELQDRLRASALCDYTGEVTLASGDQRATLELARGKVTVRARGSAANTIRGGDYLAELLIGVDDPMETCALRKIRLGGEAARLIQVLFPNEHPQLQNADRY